MPWRKGPGGRRSTLSSVLGGGLAVAWALYVAGALGFALLPLIARRTFLDENAFLLDGASLRIR